MFALLLLVGLQLIDNTKGVQLVSNLSNSSFSASSSFDASCEPQDAKLSSSTSWCPLQANGNEWLQIDLTQSYVIETIRTKGNSVNNEWVKTYTLNYSISGSTWVGYGNLTGNSDANAAKDNVLSGYIVAQYLRFYPVTWNNWPSMRIEVYGHLSSPTAVPTTSVPTTSAPTTVIPTNATNPTTSAPTTTNSTTHVPTTALPTTSNPTTTHPTTAANPTTFNPTTMIPTTSTPTTATNSTTSLPTTSSPTTTNLTTYAPTTALPTTSAPITVSPTTSVPTTANPTPLIPTTTNPTTTIHTTFVPTTANPTIVNPTTAYPTTANPTISAPITSNATTTNPTTTNPTTSRPTTVTFPTTSDPTTRNPTTYAPTVTLPTTSAPITANPITVNPTTSLPTAFGPTTATATTNNPTPSSSITSNPTTLNPTTTNPTTSTPTTTVNPTTMYPTTTNHTNAANPTTSISRTAIPTTAPTKCEGNPNLENNGCVDNGCDKNKPYLRFTLSFSVCKKQPFNGNRYGLWDAIANCLCELGKNGKIDYDNFLERRRLKRGDNVCDLNVVKYSMDSLTQPVSSSCDSNGYRFHFGIEGCGECVVLTQTLNKLNTMSPSEIIDAMSSCANWFAKRADTIGFGDVTDLEYNIYDEIGTKCEVTADTNFYKALLAFCTVLLCIFVM